MLRALLPTLSAGMGWLGDLGEQWQMALLLAVPFAVQQMKLATNPTKTVSCSAIRGHVLVATAQ